MINLKEFLLALTLVLPASVSYHELEKDYEVAKKALTISAIYKIHPSESFEIVKASKKASQTLQVPLNLILGVIASESSFNRYAVSKQGAEGLMQIHSSSGVSVGEDLEEHIYNGVAHLKEYLDRFGTNKGIQAYNMGAANVAKGRGNVKFLQKVVAKSKMFG